MGIMSVFVNQGQYNMGRSATQIGEQNDIYRCSASAYKLEQHHVANKKNSARYEFTGASNLSRIKIIIGQVFSTVFASRQFSGVMPWLKKSATFPTSHRMTIEKQHSRAHTAAKKASILPSCQGDISTAPTNMTVSTRAQVVALNQTYLRAGIAALESMNPPGCPTHNDAGIQDHPALQAMITQ